MLRAANGCSLLSPTVTHSTRQPTLLLLSEPSEPSEPFPPSSYNLTVHRSNMDSRFSMEIRVEGLESCTACSTPCLSLRVADLTLVPNDFSRGQYLDNESALCGSRQHSGGVASGCLTKNHWRLVEISRAVCVHPGPTQPRTEECRFGVDRNNREKTLVVTEARSWRVFTQGEA